MMDDDRPNDEDVGEYVMQKSMKQKNILTKMSAYAERDRKLFWVFRAPAFQSPEL